MQPLVLKFGVRKILAGAEPAYTEMRDAHHLYNALVAVERWRRAAYAAIRSRYVPGLSEVEEAYQQLDEWIGEHAGPRGVRGTIRNKRKVATAKSGKPVRPTKQVDVAEELDTIAELKRWRKAASELAAPLKARFEGMTGPGNAEYKRVTSRAPANDNYAKKRENENVRRAMLEATAEPVWEELGHLVPLPVFGCPIPAVWHDAWKELARLDQTAYELRKWVGDAHCLNHGTYTQVHDDVGRAGKKPKPRPDGEPRRPRKRPAFSSRGLRKLGWQIQGRLTWDDILNGRSRDVRLTNLRPIGGTGRRSRAEIAIRISTPRGADHDWVTLDVVLHRPIPLDTRILYVYLVPNILSHHRIEYSVQFTAVPTKPLVMRQSSGDNVIVAFCWTQVPDNNLQVARIDGVPLILPSGSHRSPGVVERLLNAERLRSFADKHFDVAVAQTRELFPILPAHVQDACAGIGSWHAHGRLSRVFSLLSEAISRDELSDAWHRWQVARLGSRLDLFVPYAEYVLWAASEPSSTVVTFTLWLDIWRRKTRHLEQMAEGARRRAIAMRRDFYRVTAARLAEKHATCTFAGAVDLASLALRDKSEDKPRELHQAGRHNRQLAACYEFQEALKHAFGKDRILTEDETALPSAAE